MPEDMGDDWSVYPLDLLRAGRDVIARALDGNFGRAGFLIPEMVPDLAEAARSILAELKGSPCLLDCFWRG